MVYLQENWENLANAIIINAVEDYQSAYKRLLRNPKSEFRRKEVEKLEEFFRGSWYAALTDLDPDYLIRRMQEEIQNDRMVLSR